MAETLPYMQSTGLVTKILEKVKAAKTPERFSQDYLGTVIGYAGGSAKPFIPMAKRLNLLNSDGSPTELYRKFRGSDEESKAAMASAIRAGYAPLFKRNEYADKLEKKKLEGLVKEVTGLEDSSSTLRAIIGTFEALKSFADFGLDGVSGDNADLSNAEAQTSDPIDERPAMPFSSSSASEASLRFGYTININLPNTNDIAVFNAIFKSLKEHLL